MGKSITPQHRDVSRSRVTQGCGKINEKSLIETESSAFLGEVTVNMNGSRLRVRKHGLPHRS